MKKLFPGYYRPTDAEFKSLWNDCIFVFDANILLNLYRYSQKTCAELLDIMKKVSDRIWIPHQVAYEYHKNRLDEILKQKKSYSKLEKYFDDSFNKIQGELNNYNRHPLIEIKSFIAKISDLFNEMKVTLKQQEGKHPDLFHKDDIINELTSLFETKVGFPYKEDELQKIYKEGEKRYQNGIPPGFLDSKKEGNDKYGDLVLWHQLLDKAKESQKDITFVTDDKKEDWWWKYGDNITIGPKPELVEEMLSYAGVNFYIYQSDQFMEYARQYLMQHVEQNTIDEIRQLREHDIIASLTSDRFDNDIKLISHNIAWLQRDLDMLLKYRDKINRELMSVKNEYENLNSPYMLDIEKFELDKETVKRIYNAECEVNKIDNDIEKITNSIDALKRERLSILRKNNKLKLIHLDEVK